MVTLAKRNPPRFFFGHTHNFDGVPLHLDWNWNAYKKINCFPELQKKLTRNLKIFFRNPSAWWPDKYFFILLSLHTIIIVDSLRKAVTKHYGDYKSLQPVTLAGYQMKRLQFAKFLSRFFDFLGSFYYELKNRKSARIFFKNKGIFFIFFTKLCNSKRRLWPGKTSNVVVLSRKQLFNILPGTSGKNNRTDCFRRTQAERQFVRVIICTTAKIMTQEAWFWQFFSCYV